MNQKQPDILLKNASTDKNEADDENKGGFNDTIEMAAKSEAKQTKLGSPENKEEKQAEAEVVPSSSSVKFKFLKFS